MIDHRKIVKKGAKNERATAEAFGMTLVLSNEDAERVLTMGGAIEALEALYKLKALRADKKKS